MSTTRKPNAKNAVTHWDTISLFRKAAMEALKPEQIGECMKELHRQVIHAKTDEGRREAAKILFPYILGKPVEQVYKEVETTNHAALHPENLSNAELAIMLKALGIEEEIIEVKPESLTIDSRPKKVLRLDGRVV